MVRVLINVPKQVKRDEPFDVKLLISHPMESGERRDAMGEAIPRDIINSFVCTYNAVAVTSPHPARAARHPLAEVNPAPGGRCDQSTAIERALPASQHWLPKMQ